MQQGNLMPHTPRGKIHHGDCLAVMATMEPGSVAGVVTSPPYNLRNSTGSQGTAGFGRASRLFDAAYDGYDDNMDHSEYVAWQRECLSAMMKLLVSDGVIFYNHTWRVQDGLLQDRADIVAGFPVRQIIIWYKSGGMNFNDQYFLPTYEVIYMIAKKDFRLPRGMNAYGNVWDIPQEMGSAKAHPAAFPIKLARRCVKAIGKGPILDPFMGSGTTAIAAEHEGLPWIGIEQSEKYVRQAESRLGMGAWQPVE